MAGTLAMDRTGAVIRLIAAIACVELVALSGPLVGRAQAEESCQPLVDTFNALLPQSKLDATLAAARAIIDGTTCRAAVRDAVGRAAALAHLHEAEQIADTPANAGKKLQLLEAGMKFGTPWQLMATIGDLRKQVRNAAGQFDYKGASLAYQAALTDIADKQSVPVPPPPAEIRRLVHLAHQDRLAADEFMRGDVLMTRDFRGVMVESVPVPIQFVFARDEMTEQGQRYADDMLRILRDQQMPRIALVGHTDHVGGDQYNLELSLRRAQAIKRFLVKEGYPAESINVEGRGWREPLQIEDEKQYTKQIIDQMLRRVELKFR